MDLQELRKKQVRYGIGVSAGGSCRGIQGALVRIKGAGPGLLVKLVASETFPHPQGFRTRLMVARKDSRELGLLHHELGQRLAEASLALREVGEGEPAPDFIASQGHVLAHTPQRGGGGPIGGLEIGEPAFIAEKTGLPVVSNFRARDMATGGQGADVVLTANSSVQTHEMALKMVGNRGRVNLFGGVPSGAPPIALESNLIHYKELFLTGSHGSVPRQHRLALDVLAAGVIDAKQYITHIYPLSQIEKAFDAAEGHAGMKVIVRPQKG